MAKGHNPAVRLPNAALAVAICTAPVIAQVQFRVVVGFGAYQQPGPLAEGAPEVFYSVGGSGPGYAFSVTPRGTLTQLAAFPNGHGLASAVSAANGRLYGWVYGSGSTYAFSVASTQNSLISYTPQSVSGLLTQNLPDGTLLGIGGQLSTGLDYLFKCDLRGKITSLYQFPLGEVLPDSAIYATDGNYYGDSWQQYAGGVQGTGGYIYRVTPAGILTKLYILPSGTFASLTYSVPILQATDGNLYGVTTQGGINQFGSVYQLTPAGQFTTIYSFTKGPGAYPMWLIQASDGNLYTASLGTSVGNSGQLSRITTNGQFTLLHTMLGESGSCPCALVQGSDGIIYGTAANNGPFGGGDVFAINAGLPKPAPRALSFTPAAGHLGTQVRIWGYNMLKATVSFNGVAATTVHNSGPNYLFATVPTGATTGPITVKTSGGTSTTRLALLCSK